MGKCEGAYLLANATWSCHIADVIRGNGPVRFLTLLVLFSCKLHTSCHSVLLLGALSSASTSFGPSPPTSRYPGIAGSGLSGRRISTLAKEAPGALMASGIEVISRYLARRGGAANPLSEWDWEA